MSPFRNRLLIQALVAVALVTATILAYCQAGDFGLINCDDYDYLLSGPSVFGTEKAIWMPLTWLTYRLESALGFDYGMQHLTSVALHAVNAALIFALLVRLFRGRVWIAAFAAFFWAVHPLRVESVVWLASRKDVLSATFFLSALLIWSRTEKWTWIATALAINTLGAAAKPSVMVFPVFALFVDFLIVRKRKNYLAYGIALALSGLMACEAAWAQGAGGACETLSAVPLWYRLWNAVSAVSIYLGNELACEGMAPQCAIRWPYAPRYSLVGAVLLATMAVYIVRGRLMSVRGGLATFLIALLPFLGIVGFGIHSLADRFTILPSVALSMALVALLEDALPSRTWCLRAGGIVGLGCLSAALFFATRRQVTFWEDDVRLFSHTVQVDGYDSHFARMELGIHYYEYDHDMDRVYDHLSKIRPEHWNPYGGYGTFFMEAALETGHATEADQFFGWLSQWDSRRARLMNENSLLLNKQGNGTRAYALANVLRLAYRRDPELKSIVAEQFADAAKGAAKSPDVLSVAYRLALLEGRDGEQERVAASKAEGDLFMKNRWAQKRPSGP